MIRRLHVIILISQLFQGTVAARNKVARISPLPTINTAAKPSSGKGKGKKGSLNIQELHELGLSQVSMLNISFFEDETSNMIFNWTYSLDGDDTSWYGEAMNGIGSITIIRPHKSFRFTGSASFNNTMYTITTLPNGSVQLNALNVTDLPSDIAHINKLSTLKATRRLILDHKQSNENTPRDLVKSDDGTIIDIMCIYTRQALCQEAIGADYCNVTMYRKVMDNKCALAVAETNVAYNLSGVQTTLRLVHSDYLDPSYNETADFLSNINNLMYSEYYGNDPVFLRVHQLRDQYRADLVGLILDNNQYCGASPGFYNDAYYGFFSVNRRCMTGYFSFGHEIGHTLGCNHEAEQYLAATKPSQSAYGYQDTNSAFRSIMSYGCSNGVSCPRIQRFSNPNSNFSYQNAPIGSSSANNVAQINFVLFNAANYRLSVENTATSTPTGKPSGFPSSTPSKLRTTRPTLRPIVKPSTRPSRRPTFLRSKRPSRRPTVPPSRRKPTLKPTRRKPTFRPTRRPSRKPSKKPMRKPTSKPSLRNFRKPL